MSTNLCIIPARGGSKRIPRKNIKPFLGKPIITYSIETALSSGIFDEVMVSTDDPEIQLIAEQAGATVPVLRSSKNSDDHATTIDVIKEVVQWYQTQGKQFDQVCCLYPCAPFVTEELLVKGVGHLGYDNCNVSYPVVAFSYPIQRALKLSDEQSVTMFDKVNELSRSQDMEKAYHDAGQFYWMKVKIIKSDNGILANKAKGIVVDEMEVQDIDTLSDWKMAELKYQLLNKSEE